MKPPKNPTRDREIYGTDHITLQKKMHTVYRLTRATEAFDIPNDVGKYLRRKSEETPPQNDPNAGDLVL